MEETKKEYGRVLHSWTVPEFERYERGKWWHAFALTMVMAAILYALYNRNFLFAFIIIIFAIIIFLHHSREPADLRIAVTELGILINDKFYRFRDMSSFWLIYEPPLTKSLYLELADSFLPPVKVGLGDVDPVALRQTMLQFLIEDLEKKEEPLSDLVWRLLKL